jgi:alkanesulfonate monooxygenase SsuD/methylene tetrahydromethanopterin reductase-like flavin-dependent oxidoreductase (luciferase family)
MDFAVFDELSTVEGDEMGSVYDAHLGLVSLAERGGYHSYWFAEHHFGADRAAPSPNLLIAAASRITSSILLGSMVNVLPFHNPVRLAEETAMLDHLTHGRVQFGIGRGVRPPEFRRYKVDMNLSREMFSESFELHKQLWTTPGATADGEYWSFEDVTIVPSVLQQPYPPVWCTGMSRESARWAGAQGIPFVTSFLAPDETQAIGDEYRSSFVPSTLNAEPCFGVMRHLYMSDSFETARDEVGHVYDRLFHHWLDVALTSQAKVPESYKAYPERHVRLGNMKLDELVAEGLILFGGKEEVKEAVQDHANRGTDLLMVWVSPWGVQVDQAAQCLERFATDVMPDFSAQPSSMSALIGTPRDAQQVGHPAS